MGDERRALLERLERQKARLAAARARSWRDAPPVQHERAFRELLEVQEMLDEGRSEGAARSPEAMAIWRQLVRTGRAISGQAGARHRDPR